MTTQYLDDWNDYMKTGLGQKAAAFDRANPKIMELVLQFSTQVKRKGFRQFSINSIFERIRWWADVETVAATNATKKFKLSNNHRAYYARTIMAFHPDFEGFFNVKESGKQVFE